MSPRPHSGNTEGHLRVPLRGFKEAHMGDVRAKTSFAAAGRFHVREGQVLSSSDPVVAGREHLFDRVDGQVEAATAAPGEKRDIPKRPCPVDGCDYEGSPAGMKIHTARAHG